MQFLGVFVLIAVVMIGFQPREYGTISLFDPHALCIVLLGSLGAILLGSRTQTFFRTFYVLKELFPGIKSLSSKSKKMDTEREEIAKLWEQGQRAKASEIAEKSKYQTTQIMMKHLIQRSSSEALEKDFTIIKHEEMTFWQPALNNWELLGKLGPSFGMVGTITGMIQLFKSFSMDSASSSIGPAMSLALVATLYGVGFGAGIAGPIGHFLGSLLDERLSVVERCEMSTAALIYNNSGE